MSENEYLTTKEAATLLRMDVKTLYMWIAKGRFPHAKVAGRYRFTKQLIQQWIDQQWHESMPVNSDEK